MPNRLPFPSEEAELNTYFETGVKYLEDNQIRLGVSDDDMIALLDEHSTWKVEYPNATTDATSTKTNVKNKNKSLKKMLVIMRRIYADFPKSKMIQADYDTLGINPRSGTQSKNPAPKSSPITTVDSGSRLVHYISFMDDVAEASSAKPDGIKSCQLWTRIGSEAKVITDLTFVGNCTKWPYKVEFEGTDAGKMAYYWARWENTIGQVGNWGCSLGNYRRVSFKYEL